MPKDLDTELPAPRGHYCTKLVASTERSMLQTDDCIWQVNYLQSLTASPRSFTHNADSCFNLNMPDFHVKRKGLRRYPIRSTGWNSNGFGFAHEVSFV